MPAQYVTGLGYMIAAVLSGIALYQWRRAVGLYALLVEGANRFEEIRLKGQQIEQAYRKSDETIRLHQEKVQAATKNLDQARKAIAELQAEVEKKQDETDYVRNKFQLQVNYLEKELAKRNQEFLAFEEKRANLVNEVASARSRANGLQEDVAKYKQELFLIEKDWQAKLLDAEQQIKNLKGKAEQGDPQEIIRLKRKVAQYDRLYASMRGLRDMSDERNKNWEVALRHFATWILQQKAGKGGVAQDIPGEIGPLVGQALQYIGAQLIDDDHEEHHGGDISSEGDRDIAGQNQL